MRYGQKTFEYIGQWDASQPEDKTGKRGFFFPVFIHECVKNTSRRQQNRTQQKEKRRCEPSERITWISGILSFCCMFGEASFVYGYFVESDASPVYSGATADVAKIFIYRYVRAVISYSHLICLACETLYALHILCVCNKYVKILHISWNRRYTSRMYLDLRLFLQAICKTWECRFASRAAVQRHLGDSFSTNTFINIHAIIQLVSKLISLAQTLDIIGMAWHLINFFLSSIVVHRKKNSRIFKTAI